MTKRSGTMASRLHRLLILTNRLRKGDYPSVEVLCQSLEIAPRTLFDDIRELRERAGQDIRFDRSRNGYHCVDGMKPLPEFGLTLEEFVLLVLGGKLLCEYGGNSFEPAVHNALDKVSARLSLSDPSLVGLVERAVQCVASADSSVSCALVTDVLLACRSNHTLALSWQSTQDDARASSTLEPLQLIHSASGWELVAHCRSAKTQVRLPLRTVTGHRVLRQGGDT